MRSIVELIAHKRDGGNLTTDEVRSIIQRFTRGEVADYQMTSFAMAVFFRGMSDDETTALTLAMRDSGLVVDLGAIQGQKVDKHSTGGVGDKVSLCLAPLVAACGVYVPMVSGRGLGHTGGTLDKLEAIPGFKVDMSTAQFVKQVGDLKCALIGQTADIAPADKRFYALRDVSATVESIPLITASILSKKLAEGIDALVLDVKVGRGAFMKTHEDARRLAESLVRVGKLAGKRVTAFLTDMRAPLGRAVGNALETAEAFDILRGGGPDDLREVTLLLGAEMLVLGGAATNEARARHMLETCIQTGAGVRKMEEIIVAQGGDPRTVTDTSLLPRAAHQSAVVADQAGYVAGIDALEIGLASVALGAGRTRADQPVDPGVGIVIDAPVGSRVQVGTPLATLHTRTAGDADAIRDRVAKAFSLGVSAPQPSPLVLEIIR